MTTESERTVEAAARSTDTGNVVAAATVSGSIVQVGNVQGNVHLHSAAERPVPRQLPLAPAPFVGRTSDLTELTAAVDGLADEGGAVVISALSGAGGIGKTWLAVHWAHSHRDRFPDGQLFIDLRGFSPESSPMAADVAVRGFLDALGIEPGRMPVELHAQVALYRSLIASKRMLILIDNAATVDQILPLLPGDSSCTVLVTSRLSLTGLVTTCGARHLRLGCLADDEARALLTARLGSSRVAREPAAVNELLARCAGYPLALAIIAGRAQTNPHISLATLASELCSAGTPLDLLDDVEPITSLPAVLSWSYQGLSPEQQKMFTLLGIAPGSTIAVPAAASLAGLPIVQTQALLRALDESSLVTRTSDGRYEMHDLIRDYAVNTAHQHLAEDLRSAATRRVIDFYVHTAYAGDCILNPFLLPVALEPARPGVHLLHFANRSEVMAWFDAEHLNLLAAQRTAAARHWHHIVWQLAWSMATFHTWRGHLGHQIAVWQEALATPPDLPDSPHGPAHRSLGRAYAEMGRHEQAIEQLHQALSLAEHDKELADEAWANRELAWAWGRHGDDQQALPIALRALTIFRELAMPAWEAVTLNTVGWHAAHLADYDTAREHCHAALVLHQANHNVAGQAATYDTLGYIEHHTGHHQHAIRHYREALTLRRSLDNTYRSADTLDGLGHPYLASGQAEQARAVWREALTQYQQQGRDEEARRTQHQLDALDLG